MPEVRSYVVERTQRVHILTAESPSHAIALADNIFREEGEKVDQHGRRINGAIRIIDISAREEY